MRKIYTTLIFVTFLISGCASTGSLRPGMGSTFDVVGSDYDEIWKAAITSVSRSLTIVTFDKQAGTIKAEARAGIATWGEVVGVFINPTSLGQPQYMVEVVSEKRMQTQITGQNWEPTIIAGIKAELDL